MSKYLSAANHILLTIINILHCLTFSPTAPLVIPPLALVLHVRPPLHHRSHPSQLSHSPTAHPATRVF
ncbi:hypothetical protein BOTBODRAFT_34981, partial [Botryobasidium botryosum FD-172 SS1]